MENLENIIIYSFGIFVFGFVVIYFWLLVKKIKKFSQYHEVIRKRRSLVPTYIIFILAILGFLYSTIKLIFTLNLF